MEGLAPTGSDAEIIDNMSPQLDLIVDWPQIQKIRPKKLIVQKNI